MNHADLLALLLPPTSLDPNGSLLGAELLAEGNALDADLMSAGELLDESDPRVAVQLLTDWERVAGLPDAGTFLPTTMQERRNSVVARITGIGGASAAYFIALAKSIGYDVTIDDYRPFRAGLSDAGDPLTNEMWIHWWMVRAAAVTTFDFKAGASSAGDPVRSWGVEPLECLIKKFKPAHTDVTFAYGV